MRGLWPPADRAELALGSAPPAPVRAWLETTSSAFERERLYLVRLTSAVGPIPSTPGAAETEAALLAQRHALETLARSERSGCALGAATALVADWAALRPLLDKVAVRVGVDVPACALPGEASIAARARSRRRQRRPPSAPSASAPSSCCFSSAPCSTCSKPAARRARTTKRFSRPARAGPCVSTGTSDYVATDDLKVAVNAAVTLRRPLLVKGEPGTGKTVLAHEIAKALDAPLIEWHVKSTTRAHQGLYEYDAVARLRDGQLGEERVHDIRNYIKRGKLWDAFTAPQLPVLLIDEIDKADIEFPNDLLQELDRMEFHVYETGETVKANERPIVVITSNNEKELPDAFLRRCFFHYIAFPDRATMEQIVEVHFPGIRRSC